MVFEKNRKNLTYYQTPYGQMLVGVNTKSMEVKVTDKNIDVSLDYELDVNHEPMADCTIKMNILWKCKKCKRTRRAFSNGAPYPFTLVYKKAASGSFFVWKTRYGVISFLF